MAKTPSNLFFGTVLKLLFWASLVWVAALVLAAGLYRDLDVADQTRAKFELFRYLMQFCVVVVLGGVATAGWKYLDTLRARRVETRRVLTGALTQIITDYNAYKSLKRMARSKIRGTDGAAHVAADAYETLMTDLNAVQLSFEATKRQVKANPDIFGYVEKAYARDRAAGSLAEDIKQVEAYLNRTVGEFETALRQKAETETRVDLADLPVFASFVAEGSGKGSEAEVAFEALSRALRLLSQAVARLPMA